VAVAIAAVLAVVTGGAAPSRANETARPATGREANVYVSTAGSDATCARGRRALPCLTFNKAYDIARNGDVVEVAAGAYGAQSIARDEKYTTRDVPDVTFRPAAGAKVTIADMKLGRWVPVEGGTSNAPSNITIRDMADNQKAAGNDGSFNGGAMNDCEWTSGTDAFYITVVNIDACNMQISGSHSVTIRGGNWGPCTTGIRGSDGCSNMKIVDGSSGITIDRAYIHDFRILPGSGEHLECLFIVSGQSIMIKNSTFEDCEFYDIFVQRYDGHELDNLTIQNNFFDAPWNGSNASQGGVALGLSPRNRAFNDILVRFNSFHSKAYVDTDNDRDGTVHSDVRIIANVLPQVDCNQAMGVSYGYNVVVAGRACNPADKRASSRVYRNMSPLGAGGDYHLSAGPNPAVDAVTRTSHDYVLRVDRDGDPRPAGAGRDAGADERVAQKSR
jgi:hypothetical protein